METNDHNRLLFKIAWLYYEKGLTQIEIAKQLGLSRQKIQRLLDQSRKEGIVRISLLPVLGTFSDMEKELEQRFALREALVIETSDYHNQANIAKEVGSGAAEYLLRVVRSNSNIVISWGGTLLGMVNAISSNQAKDIRDTNIIQGLGGIADPNHEAHASDLTRRLAKSLNAQAVLLAAPGVAGSRKACDAFYGDPFLAEALQRARNADIAFMGIGAPRKDSILIRDGNIVSWDELTALIEQGAVGDISLRYFDKFGQMIHSDLDDRTIGLTLQEIKNIGYTVGVAGGSVKLKAIKGALEGNLINVLVTDHVTAEKLLNAQ